MRLGERGRCANPECGLSFIATGRAQKFCSRKHCKAKITREQSRKSERLRREADPKEFLRKKRVAKKLAYAADPVKYRKAKAAWRAKNAGWVAEYRRNWRNGHPERCQEYNRKQNSERQAIKAIISAFKALPIYDKLKQQGVI